MHPMLVGVMAQCQRFSRSLITPQKADRLTGPDRDLALDDLLKLLRRQQLLDQRLLIDHHPDQPGDRLGARARDPLQQGAGCYLYLTALVRNLAQLQAVELQAAAHLQPPLRAVIPLQRLDGAIDGIWITQSAGNQARPIARNEPSATLLLANQMFDVLLAIGDPNLLMQANPQLRTRCLASHPPLD